MPNGDEKKERLSPEEALAKLQAAGVPVGPGPKKSKIGNLGSLGSGGSRPMITHLLSAVIALVLAVAVVMYLAPTKGQFTSLVNQHNALNSSITGFASSDDLGTLEDLVEDCGDTLELLQPQVQGLTSNVSAIMVDVPAILDFSSGLSSLNFGGTLPGNVSGNLTYVLDNYWHKWYTLDSEVSAPISLGGILPGNVTGNLSYVLGDLWDKWYTLNESESDLTNQILILETDYSGLETGLLNLESFVSGLSVPDLSGGTVSIGNCSDCTLAEAITYLYYGSRYGDW